MIRPAPQDIRDLRSRHHITQKEFADSLYHITTQAVASWESGRRNIPLIVWWAAVLTWDKTDLWNEEHE